MINLGTLTSPKRHLHIDASIIKTGFDPNACRFNFQVQTHAQHGDLDAARKLFDEMPHKNVISTNTMIMGYIKSGNLCTTRSLFGSMVQRSVVSWTMLIGCYTQNNQFPKAFGLFTDMCRHGTDHITLATLLSGFPEFESVKEVEQVHPHVVKLGYDSTLMVCNSLLDSYCKTGGLGLACHLFKNMPEKDNVTFNVLLRGYSKEGFNHMMTWGIKLVYYEPDEIMWSSILNSCRIHKNQKLAKKAADQLFNMKVLRDAAPYVSMSNIHAAAGELDNVGKVKKAMRE